MNIDGHKKYLSPSRSLASNKRPGAHHRLDALSHVEIARGPAHSRTIAARFALELEPGESRLLVRREKLKDRRVGNRAV
jgi:hypothetical protein